MVLYPAFLSICWQFRNPALMSVMSEHQARNSLIIMVDFEFSCEGSKGDRS